MVACIALSGCGRTIVIHVPADPPPRSQVAQGPFAVREPVPTEVVRPAPSLDRASQDYAAVGDFVRITGKNLDGRVVVSDRAGHELVTEGTGDAVVFQLPPGWQSGGLRVTTEGGSAAMRMFTVGRNLSRTAVIEATSFHDPWTSSRVADGNLATSWFSSVKGSSVSVKLAQPSKVGHVAFRSNREPSLGSDIRSGRLDVIDDRGNVAYSVDIHFSDAQRDLDLPLPTLQGKNVRALRFTVLDADRKEAGLAEIEAFESLPPSARR